MKTRLKIFFGTILIFIICGALFIYMDYMGSRLGSTAAVLKSDTVTVGTDYAGTVTKQFVQVGDPVTSGETLFYVKSSSLIQALNSNQLQAKDLLYALTPDRQLIVTANAAGFMSSINYGQGSYVPNSSVIATITTNDALIVSATFKMSPTQYALTTNDTPLVITLPDGSTATAQVNDVSITTQTNPLVVTVSGTVKGLSNQSAKAGQNGTPVNASLTLRQNTYWSKLKHWLSDL